MKKISFVIIDDDQSNGLKTKAVAESFQSLRYVGYANNYDDALDCILEQNPDIVFLEIDPKNTESRLSLYLINELYRFLTVIPKILVTAKDESKCIEAFKYGVSNYFVNPVSQKDLRKAVILLEKEFGVQRNDSNAVPQITSPILPQQTLESDVLFKEQNIQEQTSIEKLEVANEVDHVEAVAEIPQEKEEIIPQETEIISEEEQPRDEMDFDILGYEEKEEEPSDTDEANQPNEVNFFYNEKSKTNSLIICVKSYGDYRYIEAKDICYLQADNNSTDIHLNGGEMITAFKTLKHFENILNYPFVRIHNSYIINSDYVSRIHTGNTVCHIKDTTIKLPFSKSYKENVDAIIAKIASGNYIEI